MPDIAWAALLALLSCRTNTLRCQLAVAAFELIEELVNICLRRALCFGKTRSSMPSTAGHGWTALRTLTR